MKRKGRAKSLWASLAVRAGPLMRFGGERFPLADFVKKSGDGMHCKAVLLRKITENEKSPEMGALLLVELPPPRRPKAFKAKPLF